jgi:hypothetical protein
MYEAFGDESCGQTFVAYGVLLVCETQMSDAEAILTEVKKRFGGEDGHRLHCREMFGGHARSKTPWANLSMADVFNLYEALMTRLRDANLRRLVAIARKSDFPDRLPALPMQHIDPSLNVSPRWTKEMQLGEKQLAAWCAQGVMIPLTASGQVRLWADPDKTSIEWLDGKRAATRAIDGFVDIGPDKEPPRINVMPVTGEKPKLLEVADCIAYVAQRSRTSGGGNNDRRFKSLEELIDPELIRFAVAPDGGFGFSVPNSSHRTV